jgi:type I restriction enzyme M protein
MAKSRDFQPSLKHFIKVFNSFKGYYYDYDIFSDFIDFSVGCLLWEGDQDLADRLKKKYENDYPLFAELFRSMITTMDENLSCSNWFDVLGTLYESIASYSKCSFMGQFFTPAPVCDLIAAVQADADMTGKKLLISDPAAGSGRMLLAFNGIAPGNILIAQDIDQICTKMSAINMAIHGCQGQAINGNSLGTDDIFRFGYEVNPNIMLTHGIPHLIPMKKENALPIIVLENKLKKIEIQQPAQQEIQQLALF